MSRENKVASMGWMPLGQGGARRYWKKCEALDTLRWTLSEAMNRA